MNTDFAKLAERYDIDRFVAEIDDYIAKTRLAEQKSHKKLVEYQIAPYNDCPYKAILNRITLPCAVQYTAKHFVRTVMNIDQSSPQEVRDIYMYYKVYFASVYDEQNYEKCKRGDLQDFKFFSHSVAKSPAAMVVKHRYFFVTAKFCRTDAGYRIYMKSIPEQFAVSYDNAVTGELLGGYFQFTGTDQKSDIEQFLLADPSGNVPGPIYNVALGARNDVLLFAVKYLEQLKGEGVE